VKILFFTDLHLRRTSPRWRKDNYALALLKKLEFIVSLAKAENCDRVYFGGDFVDSPMASISLVNQAVDILEALTRNGIEFTAAFGQHDEQGNTPQGVEASVASLLYRIPDNDLPPMTKGIDFLFGDTMVAHYNNNILDILRNGQLTYDNNEYEQVTILLIHAMLTLSPVPWPHIQIDDVVSQAKIILSGDYHIGFPPTLSNGTWFINPGAIARTTVADANKIPKVAIINTDKLPDNPAKYIEIECAPAHEAFDLEAADEAKQSDDERSQYTMMLQDMAEAGGQKNWEAILDRAAKDGKVDQAVIEEARHRCKKIEEEQNE